MPERRGRGLAGAPKSGNVIFISGLSNFWWMLHNHHDFLWLMSARKKSQKARPDIFLIKTCDLMQFGL